jgi:hypothetical protein
VHATARGGHHRGRVLSSVVVPDVQPPMVWYFETWHFAFVFVFVSWLVWSYATVAPMHMNQCPGPDVKRDHLQQDTTTLVSKPCSVNPFRVHIWARGYDQGEASLIHTNTYSWCRLSLFWNFGKVNVHAPLPFQSSNIFSRYTFYVSIFLCLRITFGDVSEGGFIHSSWLLWMDGPLLIWLSPPHVWFSDISLFYSSFWLLPFDFFLWSLSNSRSFMTINLSWCLFIGLLVTFYLWVLKFEPSYKVVVFLSNSCQRLSSVNHKKLMLC